jgi:succinate dehydrogenase / fumarate reductase flavoprotein subunit
VALGIDVFMECTITRLITGPGPGGADRAVVGGFGYWRTTGAPVVFPAKAVVLATGGIGKAYTVTSNSWEYSGDGHALAYSVGADLIDMEFVQFHPTGMVWPPGVRGLLVTEAVRGEGGILRNKDGKRFMWDYLPEDRRGEYAATDEEAVKWVTAQSQGRLTDARRPPELSTRDNVSRAIYTEVREGRGSPHGGVFLDISYLPAEHVRRKLPSMYDQFKELADVDITKGPMEVGPTTHYVMGGVRVDAETGAATVPGLFAAGEVAGGMHGANRLGGNSLSDLLVFGMRTGAGAAAHAATLKSQPYLDPVQLRDAERELAAPLERGSGENPYTIQHDLQDVMQRLVGIFRVQGDLQDAISELARLKARWPGVAAAGGRTFNPGWNLVFELRNLLVISEAVTRSALQRTESRGAHSRIDFPETDQAGWGGRNSVVRRRVDGSMEVNTTALPEMPDELRLLLGGAH